MMMHLMISGNWTFKIPTLLTFWFQIDYKESLGGHLSLDGDLEKDLLPGASPSAPSPLGMASQDKIFKSMGSTWKSWSYQHNGFLGISFLTVMTVGLSLKLLLKLHQYKHSIFAKPFPSIATKLSGEEVVRSLSHYDHEDKGRTQMARSELQK